MDINHLKQVMEECKREGKPIVMIVCTMGSATNRPDLTFWGPYLMGLDAIVAAFDGDLTLQREGRRLDVLDSGLD